MSVKDIIILACDFTENKEIGEALENNSTLTDEQNAIVNDLVKCFNLINNEIASEYFPIIKCENAKTENFKINLSSLSNSVLRVIAVQDYYGRKIKFKIYDDYIMAIANNVNVIYQSLPGNLSLSDEFFTTLPNRVYAYGIAREYYFLQTLFDEADVWEERFKDVLSILQGKRNEIRMPQRRFL